MTRKLSVKKIAVLLILVVTVFTVTSCNTSQYAESGKIIIPA